MKNGQTLVKCGCRKMVVEDQRGDNLSVCGGVEVRSWGTDSARTGSDSTERIKTCLSLFSGP